MTGHLVVLSTAPDARTAELLACQVVESGLAACANVVPGVISIYRWKGEIHRDDEHLLVIKTRADRFEAVRDALVREHTYDVPEVLALPVVAGHAPYLAWLDEAVAQASRLRRAVPAAPGRTSQRSRARARGRRRGPRRPRTRR